MRTNKRGGDRILSLYWFIIFIIVAIAVVSGVYIFFSKPIDTREAESGILADKVIDCFVTNGQLKQGFNEINSGNLQETCGLNLDDKTGKYTSVQYYIQVSIGIAGGQTVSFGNENYLPFCGQEKSRLNIPYCYQEKIMVYDGKEFVPFIVTGIIGKIEQNAV